MIYHISLAVIGLSTIALSFKEGAVPVALVIAYCVVLGMKISEAILSRQADQDQMKEIIENHDKVVEQLTDLRGQFNILRNHVGTPSKDY